MRKKILLILLTLWCFGVKAQNLTVSIDTPLPVCNPGYCTDLQANFTSTQPTGTYTVASIPYVMPGFTNPGTNLVVDDSNHEDDIWGPVVSLPFSFCFYGQKYDHLMIGTNGVVSFNINPSIPGGIPGGVEVPLVLNAPGYCDWNFNQNLPSPGFHTANAIYGVYQDTEYKRICADVPPGNACAAWGIADIDTQFIKYYAEGVAPNRTFTVFFSKIPHYSCGQDDQTSYIVLHETSNIIDVIVTTRTLCGWQGGAGVIGVMNQAGTLGTVPPGRNTNDDWVVSVGETWRFTPAQAGPSNTTLTWLEGGAPIPGSTNVNPLSVCPTSSTVYTAVVTYTECDGSVVTIQDTETVAPETFPLREPLPITICTTGTAPYNFNIDQTAYMLNGLPASDYNITYHVDAAGAPGAIIPNGSLASYPSPGAGELIWVVVEDLFTTGCPFERSFPLNAVSSPTGTFTYTNSPYCSSLSTPQLPTLTGLTPGGAYTATPAGLTIDATTGAVTPSTSGIGTYSVKYRIEPTASCPFYETFANVTITASPLAPTVTTPVTYCQNATAGALTATGTALLWYTTATGGTGSATAPTPSTTIAGSTTYYVTQTVSGCESVREAIVVDVTPTPLAPIVTTPVTYCQNATATALTATGTGLLWYTTATGGTGSATAPTPSTATAGTTTYYVTQTASGCESPRASIDVVVTPLPVAPTVTTPIGYCQNATATALTATGTGLLWYTVATGGVGTATAPTPNTATVGSTTHYVSQTVSGCEGPRASIVVNIAAPPSAPTVTTPLTYCQNTTAAVLTATGTGLLWYTAATGGTGSTTAPTPGTITAGSTTYYVSQTVSGCESARAGIVVDVTPTPLAPGVTTPVTYCQNATATALTATGTALLWYTAATGGTGSVTAPTPSTATAGTTTYYVTQTVSSCESPRASIDVVVTPLPVAPTVTTPVGYCQNATASVLTATGTGLLWYTVATGGVGTATAPTPNTATVGSTTHYVSQTVSGCEGPRASIVVTITATPSAPTVTTPLTYCQNTTAAVLTATGTGLLWYTAATGGTGSTTAPTPGTITAGSTTYYVSQTVSGCESPRAGIVVNVTGTPLAPTVTTPVTYCQNATATALTATGTALLWYTAATGGTGSVTAPTPSTATAGSTTYYVTQTVSGCESPRASIVVTITAPPAAPTVTTPIGYCQNATAVALTATGSNLLWYTVATGGIGSATAPTPSTAAVGSTTYYVSQTVSGCEGPRASIVVTITATPSAPTVTTPVPYCQNAAAVALTATGSGLLWYTTATGGAGSATAPIPSTATVGSTTYYVSQTTASCESPRAAISVDVKELPKPTLYPGYVCVDGQTGAILNTYLLNAGLDNTSYDFIWYNITTGTPVVIAGETQNVYVVTTPGTYGVQAINVSTGCRSLRVDTTVGTSSPPQAITVTTSNYFAEVQTITINATPSGNYEYELDNGGFQSSNVFTNVGSGEHTIKVRDVNQCGVLSINATIIDFPKFFTPNGDGYHDRWNISALSGQANAKIYIFDRFGKLLKEIRPSSSGWDGTFNDLPLPSTDYWFIVYYNEDNQDKEFKSHFALKR
ncbi:T9SS type B sorting domain-containing protein [Flavobacterium sp.]|uniref:Ig-like domain-containing protein n=1 Tax=Flavobacterium sp. TaxID=239 RepID=UPI003D6AD9BE